MPNRRTRVASAWTVFLCFGSSLALADGSAADYARAAKVSELARNTVFKAQVTPHWFGGGNRFWYRNALPDGGGEFIAVDAEKSERRPAFDAAKLADALAKLLNHPVDALRLPFDRITIDGTHVLFRIDGIAYDCDTDTHTVTPAADKKVDDASDRLQPMPRQRASREGGEATRITFVNRTTAAVKIFWIDSANSPTAYGTVDAGERREMGTYAGHVWQVQSADGKSLGSFEATADAGVAEISATPATTNATTTPTTAPATRRAARRGGDPRRQNATSPDGRYVAFSKGPNVSVRDTKTGSVFDLTVDGTDDDWYRGDFSWSPDSTHLVTTRQKNGVDHKIYLVESSPTDQLQPKLHPVDYKKPGDDIDHERPCLFDVLNRKRVDIDDALFSNPWSIDAVRWDSDSSRFTFAYNQRGHQVLRVLAVNATDGKVSTIVEETSKTFIDYSGKFYLRFVNDTDLIWMSERDGWNHLYLYDAKAGVVKRQLTQGQWAVRKVDKADDAARTVTFTCGGIDPAQDPYQIHYARVNLDNGNIVRLTDGDGTHVVTPSPDGKYYLDRYSRLDAAPVTELRRTADGTRIAVLETADISRLTAKIKLPERFVAKGRDGTTAIWGAIWRPTNFDPAKRYPVIEDIYAGPQDSFVPKGFSPANTGHQSLAELGFIVVQIDGMGTNNRSRAFHDVAYKNLKDAGFPDRILWLQAAAKKHPELNITRVGIYGTSAGGQNALGAMLFHGDFYKAAVAACGCHDNRMDKIWWNEQWMGWPVDQSYDDSSNVTHAKNLKGPLLLIVGELDDNVDPASTMQVVNQLVKHDKDFDLLVIPGARHTDGGAYGDRRRKDFFVRNLLNVAPRHD